MKRALSLQFLYGSVFPHPPLCSREEALILPRGLWGQATRFSFAHYRRQPGVSRFTAQKVFLYSAGASDQSSALAPPPSVGGIP